MCDLKLLINRFRMNYIKTNKPKTVRLSYCLIIGQFTNGAKQNGKAECKFAMLHT